jgi:hypothetical protein
MALAGALLVFLSFLPLILKKAGVRTPALALEEPSRENGAKGST